MKYITLLLIVCVQLILAQDTTYMPTTAPTGPPVPTHPTLPTKKPSKSPGYVLPPHMQQDPY